MSGQQQEGDAYPEGTDIAGRYRVERVLGRGGMGMVLRARHTWTQRLVALKVILPELAASGGASSRFLREAQSAASLRHPNVVDILDMGRADDGTLFLAMELLDGEPLSRLLDREGPLDPFRAVGLLLPLIDALGLAHQHGLVHRDIKPDNLFLANVSGTIVPKLLDFGIARAFHAEGEKLTATGMVLGTPGYMAPEQIAGDPAGPAADIWAMGIVLFEALCGRPPFDASSGLGWMTRVITEPAPPIRSVNPEVAESLAAVVDRCLSRQPEDRFADAGKLAHALRRAVTSPMAATAMALPGPVVGSVESAPMARPTPMTRNSVRPVPVQAAGSRWLAIVLVSAGAVLALGALGALGYWIDRTPPPVPTSAVRVESSVITVEVRDAGLNLDAGSDAFVVLDEIPSSAPDRPSTAPSGAPSEARRTVRPSEVEPVDRRAPRITTEDM